MSAFKKQLTTEMSAEGKPNAKSTIRLVKKDEIDPRRKLNRKNVVSSNPGLNRSFDKSIIDVKDNCANLGALMKVLTKQPAKIPLPHHT